MSLTGCNPKRGKWNNLNDLLLDKESLDVAALAESYESARRYFAYGSKMLPLLLERTAKPVHVFFPKLAIAELTIS